MATTTTANPLDGTVLNGTTLGFGGHDSTVRCDTCGAQMGHDAHLYVRAKQDGMDGDWHIVWVTCPSCGPSGHYADPGYLEVKASLQFDPDAGATGYHVIADAALCEQVEHLDWRL